MGLFLLRQSIYVKQIDKTKWNRDRGTERGGWMTIGLPLLSWARLVRALDFPWRAMAKCDLWTRNNFCVWRNLGLGGAGGDLFFFLGGFLGLRVKI